MKIRDIIEAAPLPSLKSLPVGTDAGYQTGKDFGTKLLSPSQWFKGGSGGSKLDKEQQDTPDDNSTNTQPSSKQYQDSLEKAQFGTTLNTVDVQNLKVIYGKVKTGEISSDNAETDMAALKAAIDGYTLDQPQRDIVKNIINKV